MSLLAISQNPGLLVLSDQTQASGPCILNLPSLVEDPTADISGSHSNILCLSFLRPKKKKRQREQEKKRENGNFN